MTKNAVRSILAVLGGYAAMAALVTGTTAALARLWPASSDEEDSPTPTYTAANLAYSGLFAATGGYVTSSLARRSPMGHTTALAALVPGIGSLLLGTVFWRQTIRLVSGPLAGAILVRHHSRRVRQFVGQTVTSSETGSP